MNRIRTSLAVFTLLWAAIASAQVPQLPAPPAAAKPEPAPIPAAPELPVASYVLMDFHSGRVIAEHNAHARVEPASITKIMTSYIAFRELANGKISLQDTVRVSEKAWRIAGSRMFIDPTMSPTIEQLIRGMVIQSGNDASVALAEHLAGTEEAFASLMNHYASQLGLADTHFVNATGWPDENHYSTAHDIALLSAALIRDFPEYYAWYSEKEFTFNDIRQHNRNALLWRDPAIDGLKTGHTETAGFCLSASALRDGMRLISVVMGSASETARASESEALLDYGFRFFETVQLYEASAELAKGQVWKGMEDEVALGLAAPLFVTIPRGRYADLDAAIEVQPALSAPLAAQAVAGSLTVKLGDEVVAQRDLVTLAAVEPAGFFGRAWDGFLLWSGEMFGDDD